MPDESTRILDEQKTDEEKKNHLIAYHYLNDEATTLKGNC